MTIEPGPGTIAEWEDQARNWIAWTRAPGLDSYWRYRPMLFDLLPEPGRATLDLGCGEGRLTRDLAERGHRVIGLDASATLIGAARLAHPGGDYRAADAADLRFADASFDLVIAYNSLMDIDDMPGAVREAARVLEPGGRLVISILHPANTGRITGQRDDLSFVVDSSYFADRRTREHAERDGISMVFASYRRPLSAYTRALEEAGLLIEAVREPAASRPDGTAHPLPWHLWIRAVLPVG
jgi:ubiquinone/menaquinone biosynthesis C-methylase UbiE